MRVFLNDHGRFKEWDIPLQQPAQGGALPAGVSKLSDLSGLWTCVATGDFDGDGRMDIVLGNWGLNSPYQDVAPARGICITGISTTTAACICLRPTAIPNLKKIMPWRDMSQTESGLSLDPGAFSHAQSLRKATLAGDSGRADGQGTERQGEFPRLGAAAQPRRHI